MRNFASCRCAYVGDAEHTQGRSKQFSRIWRACVSSWKIADMPFSSTRLSMQAHQRQCLTVPVDLQSWQRRFPQHRAVTVRQPELVHSMHGIRHFPKEAGSVPSLSAVVAMAEAICGPGCQQHDSAQVSLWIPDGAHPICIWLSSRFFYYQFAKQIWIWGQVEFVPAQDLNLGQGI